MKRRTFLSSAAGLLYLSSFEKAFANSEFISPINDTSSLKMLATSWGLDISHDEFCNRVQQEGYDGIEAWWPTARKNQDELFSALQKHKLDIGFLCGGHDRDPRKHLEDFRSMTEAAASQSPVKPLYKTVIPVATILLMRSTRNLSIIRSH